MRSLLVLLEGDRRGGACTCVCVPHGIGVVGYHRRRRYWRDQLLDKQQKGPPPHLSKKLVHRGEREGKDQTEAVISARSPFEGIVHIERG